MARRRSPLQRIGIVLAHTGLMIGALLMVMPMLWMLATSFKPAPEIALWPPVFLPQAPSWENYTGVFETAPFAQFFANSVFIALVCTACVALTSLVAGAVFAKYRFPGRTFLFGLVLATAIVPFEAYMIPLYLQLVSIGWINTYQGIMLPFLFMAFGIFLMRQHVSSAIPTELMEAARMDGAGEWWILARVIAPLSRAGACSSGRC
jgi:multiple sugar transport system permease protein